MRLGRGTARFDVSDVRATARREAELEANAIMNELYLQRQLRAALHQRQRAWAQGYQSALEQFGDEITITNGIPEAICDT